MYVIYKRYGRVRESTRLLRNTKKKNEKRQKQTTRKQEVREGNKLDGMERNGK